MRTIKITLIIMGIFTGISFINKKEKFPVVNNFDVNKYLGTWYEIARLDYKWEKNLNNVTATYSLKDNGMIKVDNKGFDHLNKKWKQSIGKAKFAGDKTLGKIKVSFFGPFYSDYNIVALDPDHTYALIIGSSTKYMWILSRRPSIPDLVKEQYLSKAKELGVRTEDLVWVEHSKTN